MLMLNFTNCPSQRGRPATARGRHTDRVRGRVRVRDRDRRSEPNLLRL